MWWLLAAPVAWAGWLALASQSEVEALAGKPEVETALHAGILVASWCYHAATPGRSRKGLSLAVASLLVLCRAVVCCRVGDYSLLGVPFLNLALPRLVGSVLGHLSRRLERSSAVALPLPGGPTNSLIPSASPEAAAAMSAVALFDGVTGLAVAAATLLKGVAPVPGGGAEPPAWMHYFAFDTLGPRSMMVGYALLITYFVALARRLRIERFLHLWGQICAFQPLAHCAIIAARSEPLLSAADFASFVSSPPARAGRLAIGAVTAAMPRALRWKLGCIAAFSFGVGLQDVARVWRFSIWPRPSLMLDRLGLPILGFAVAELLLIIGHTTTTTTTNPTSPRGGNPELGRRHVLPGVPGLPHEPPQHALQLLDRVRGRPRRGQAAHPPLADGLAPLAPADLARRGPAARSAPHTYGSRG